MAWLTEKKDETAPSEKAPSEKAPSNVMENEEQPPREPMQSSGMQPPRPGVPLAPTNQAAPKKSRCVSCSCNCIADCIVKPLKGPMLGLGEIKTPSLLRMLGAEFLGTLLLVFFGIGSVITAQQGGLRRVYNPLDINRKMYSFGAGPNPNVLHVSLAFGIAVASIAQAIGHVSGAHLNPAVSFGLFAAGQCGLIKALLYTVAQCFGALAGAALLRMLTLHLLQERDNPDLNHKSNFNERFMYWSLGASTLAEGVEVPTGILIEAMLTFILVLTVCGCCDKLRNDVKGSAPLAIGFAVFICHVTGIGLTGASVNPARSFGPAVVAYNVKNVWRHHAVYWVGPIAGGLEAGVIYSTFFRAKEEPKPASDGRITMV